MNGLFDPRQVRRAFSRSASSYASAAKLQTEIEARLLESLDYYALDETRPDASRSDASRPEKSRPEDTKAPRVIVDLGCGPGGGARAMQQRWPKARVLALDLALPMLKRQTEDHESAGLIRALTRPFVSLRGAAPMRICADARALPLADHCVDLLFSNLCLQWIEDLPAVFAGFRRVLRPGGMLVCSTFGPDTLHELRGAFAAADTVPHVSPFASIAQFGDALIAGGFRNPVLDRDELTTHYPDLPTLMRELRAIGATNALHARRHTLTGRGRFATAAKAYEQWRGTHEGDTANGTLPATWEVITAIAWAPEHGVPIREGDRDVARFPASGIPVRRR